MKLLPIETVNAIWKAAASGSVPSARQMEVARAWLSRVFDRATQRAMRGTRVPLTRKDVDRLDAAYRRFRAVLISLQDRDYPPPLIPIRDGVTDWEYWIGSNNLDFKRGRNSKYDWAMIGSLLELYEAITHKVASGADAEGPTMRFLHVTMEAFAANDPDARHAFQCPSSDAVQDELRDLREMWNGLRDPALSGLREL